MFIENELISQGFIKIDHFDGIDRWRQKDDEPKIDIEISFIEHKDNL